MLSSKGQLLAATLTSISCLSTCAFGATSSGAENLYTATGAAAVAKAAATAKTDHSTSQVSGKAFDRIAIIWLENTDYDKAVGDPNLAWLAEKGITLENYNAVTHPSEPNYVAAIGGDYFGMDNDAFNQIDAKVSSVIDLLEFKNISWAAYQEDMPYTGFEGMSWVNQKTGANDYVRKHNPPVIFNSVAESVDRLAKIKNLTMFYYDLELDLLPQWMFITPNMTSDGHDTSVTVAGTWTRKFLEPLLDDPNFMKNTLVLVTFDENHTYSMENRILALLLGDAVPKELVGTTDSNYYNHYSEISTVEANWDLPTLGRWDVGANVFKLVADQTGDTVREWSGQTSFSDMFFNQSYAGPMNSDVDDTGYPVPNVSAIYAKREVAEWIQETWRGLESSEVYYNTALEIPDGLHPPDGWSAITQMIGH